jgi:hypothetical protein
MSRTSVVIPSIGLPPRKRGRESRTWTPAPHQVRGKLIAGVTKGRGGDEKLASFGKMKPVDIKYLTRFSEDRGSRV